MFKLVRNWRWMGKHRHLRRIRYPWLKLKYGLLWRLCLMLAALSPVIVPYVIILVAARVLTRTAEIAEESFKGKYAWLASGIGYTQLLEKQEKANVKVFHWRNRFSIGMPKVGKPIKSHYQIISETMDDLKDGNK